MISVATLRGEAEVEVRWIWSRMIKRVASKVSSM